MAAFDGLDECSLDKDSESIGKSAVQSMYENELVVQAKNQKAFLYRRDNEKDNESDDEDSDDEDLATVEGDNAIITAAELFDSNNSEAHSNSSYSK